MTQSLLQAITDSTERNEPVALATVIRCPDETLVGAKQVVWLERPPLGEIGLGELDGRILEDARAALRSRVHKTLRYPEQQIEVFVEVQHSPPQLIVVGAGHIAAPLCELGALCDFAVTVIDDRPQFANRARFPQADRVLAADIRPTVSELAVGTDCYVVLVTRGHSLDVECLLEIIDRPLAYIGMIGSRRRVRAVFDLLEREQGIPRHRLDRVFAPIGLRIAAQTPAEIAIAIMAEIISVMRGGQASSLAERPQAKYDQSA